MAHSEFNFRSPQSTMLACEGAGAKAAEAAEAGDAKVPLQQLAVGVVRGEVHRLQRAKRGMLSARVSGVWAHL